ncbi:aminotransferase class III-fold pyridoxal phosphate-dependent enzyme [Lewinella sp. IMCC34191]|uniref:aminotransferase class III-fold pyridoxal phosphate-dependent enzyme n=1 Tax=Lewinella sp. IMCC34191 TaxID=2259172 RepID=UPI000E2602EF|nr:aminotransferase class III-fold pyridoxal phosphate-dependent enzyme [Lewinella sp. IMCC34191]
MINEDQIREGLTGLGIGSQDIHSLKPLPGEVDLNYHVVTTQGAEYVLKICLPEQFDQTPILDHLFRSNLPFAVPVPARYCRLSTAEGERVLRLYTWVPGRLIADINPVTAVTLRSWGESVGHLHDALGGLDYPAVQRSYKWDPAGATNSRDRIRFVRENRRDLLLHFFDRLAAQNFANLPRSVCYNDAHEHNLLVDAAGHITGIIDFGDTVHTLSVCELAVACAYAGMLMPDPLGAMRTVVAGYAKFVTVTEEEIAALYDLIAARLLLTVTIAAENHHLEPNNEYLSVSEQPAWTLLKCWRDTAPALVTATFRVACGLPAHPLREAFFAWSVKARFAPVLRPRSPIIPLDLSVGSTQLGGNANFWELPRFVTRLRRQLEDEAAAMAVGGYGEVRPIYTTDAFQGIGNAGPRWRSVHLGLDFWTPDAEETVYAPLAGTVESCGIDPTPGGYGGTLLLRHEPVAGLTFYTLYGHLSYPSIRHLGDGAQVEAGQKLGRLGAPSANGGWPPHLHFQLILDTLGMGVDYPGVAYPEERDVWLGLCPDPRCLLAAELPPESTPPPSGEELLAIRKNHLGYSLRVSYHNPLVVLRGYRQYLYDHTGRRYLDTVNNVAHVGHEHPAVVTAGQRQMAVLNTNTRYLHPLLGQFTEQLLRTLPESLSVIHVVNSGSEANELALRMAEAVTGNRQVAAFEMGYHGNTGRTIEVSSYKFDRSGGHGKPASTFLYDIPRSSGEDLPNLPPGCWSFIGETILSCAGQVVLPPNYLASVYRQIRASGGVCIADEVQTGVGRLGTHWWAFETQHVVPDIVTIGKPIGNGHPLGVVVCTPRVAEAFANGMEYFNTFGGNPVSAAIGLAVLQTVESEGLRENARRVGDHLTHRLRDLATLHPIIREVRGSGFFLGVELHDDQGKRAKYLKNRMRELGCLMSTDGPRDNVIKIKPPMCFDQDNADLLCDYLNQVLGEDAMRL